MSENNEHISSSAFKKYLSDKTTSSDKEAFEKGIEEGSFEEEALEGFKSLENDAAAIAAINAVDQKMAKRTGRKAEGAVAFPIWKAMSIAASVILFLGVGYFLTDLIKTDDNLALNEPKVVEESLDELSSKDTEDASAFLDADLDSAKLDQILEEELRILELEEEEMELEPPPPPVIAVMDDEMVVEDAAISKAVADSRGQNQDLLEESEEFADFETVSNTSTIAQDNYIESKKERASKNSAATAPVSADAAPSAENNTYFNIAKVNFDSKNYNSAIDYFQNSIDNRQNVQEATYYIGLSYFKMNKNNKAIKYFDDVIKSKSSWVSSAKWYKILIYEERGDTSAAIELLEQLANGNSAFKNQALDKLKAY